MTQRKLKVASIGCGNRGRVYLSLISEMQDKFEIVAAADPVQERVAYVNRLSGSSSFQSFKSASALLNEERLADILIIATQDDFHFKPCIRALRLGYDIVLEKPMSVSVQEIVQLEEEALRLGRKVIVCHVLRYTSFYQNLKKIVSSGVIGDVITLHATEGVEPWHFAHSYVRGHWSVMEKSTPTIVAKCCHDMDILHWVIGQKVEKVSSFGDLSFFKKSNRHLSNDYPMFDAHNYTDPSRKVWLSQVYDKAEGSDAEILNWLSKSKWGRNVFECDNTAVDHQVVNLQFEDGVTASFTMTAFDEGRNYEICGTKGRLRAGDYYKEHMGADIVVTDHATSTAKLINVIDENPHPIYGGYHNGGDVGFIKELYDLFASEDQPLTSISTSVHSHVVAFASEEARKQGEVIEIDKYYQSKKSPTYALD